MRIKDVDALLLHAALWGGSFLFMRLAAPVIGLVVLAELRVGIAGGAPLVYVAAIGWSRRSGRRRNAVV